MKPKISILLPNYNTRPFLPQRMESIFAQTCTDWELIIVDNHSTDGSWEYFQQFSSDPRVQLHQRPKQGMYQNWNNCIDLAHGEYFYIATSDDTMTPDCLKKMLQALETNPECAMCHCCLTLIDEHDQLCSSLDWGTWPAQRFFGDLILRRHIRKAPLDGFLHLGLGNIHSSITQVLFRKSLIETCGPFRPDWGVFGDFEWHMRVSSVCSVIHIPEFLATWRRHPGQASPGSFNAQGYTTLIDMAREAFKMLQTHHPQLASRINLEKMLTPYQVLRLKHKIRACLREKNRVKKVIQLIASNQQLFIRLVIRDMFEKFVLSKTKTPYEVWYMRQAIERLGLKKNIVIL